MQSEVDMLTAAGFQLEVKSVSVNSAACDSGPKQAAGPSRVENSKTHDYKRPRHRTKV